MMVDYKILLTKGQKGWRERGFSLIIPAELSSSYP